MDDPAGDAWARWAAALVARLGAVGDRRRLPDRRPRVGPRASATSPGRPTSRCRASSSTPTRATRGCTATSCRGRSGARRTPTTCTCAAPSIPPPTYVLRGRRRRRARGAVLARRGRHAPRRERRVRRGRAHRSRTSATTAASSSSIGPDAERGQPPAVDARRPAAAHPPVPLRLGHRADRVVHDRAHRHRGRARAAADARRRRRRARPGHALGRAVDRLLGRVRRRVARPARAQHVHPAEHAAGRRAEHRLRRRLLGPRTRTRRWSSSTTSPTRTTGTGRSTSCTGSTPARGTSG